MAPLRRQRIKLDRYGLQEQLQHAATGAAGEPSWPAGGLTPADIQAKADEFKAELDQLRQLELDIQGQRAQVEIVEDEVRKMMRRVDDITSALFGRDGFQKTKFGLPPVDTHPNRTPAPPQVVKLVLSDGPSPASILLKWKAVPRAVYEAEWFATDPALPDSQRIGLSIATASRLAILGLMPGQQIWARVRAKRGKRFGPWSEAGTRIVNV